MYTEEELREALARVEGVTRIEVIREGLKFIAMVVSPQFEGRTNNDRQLEVMKHLMDLFGDFVPQWVGYVFTKTPDEYESLYPEPEAKSA